MKVWGLRFGIITLIGVGEGGWGCINMRVVMPRSVNTGYRDGVKLA